MSVCTPLAVWDILCLSLRLLSASSATCGWGDSWVACLVSVCVCTYTLARASNYWTWISSHKVTHRIPLIIFHKKGKHIAIKSIYCTFECMSTGIFYTVGRTFLYTFPFLWVQNASPTVAVTVRGCWDLIQGEEEFYKASKRLNIQSNNAILSVCRLKLRASDDEHRCMFIVSALRRPTSYVS